MELNGKKVIDVGVDGVDYRDYPDFCDAFFSEGYYEDGTPLTSEELDALADKYPNDLWDAAYKRMF